ncbi:hypothetical protein NEUTE2DRAFT_125917 [Neurospora tetrasperma FGSC 2509]|nr:hypothetical protein NEUTE2DRAFT_125917 [Neurospora tetrasperma FGSC 2509]
MAIGKVVFHNYFDNDIRWQGPPNYDVDKAWEDLYIDIGVVKISEEGGYITELEVYHELHSSDLVRKHFYPDGIGGDRDMTEQQRREY